MASGLSKTKPKPSGDIIVAAFEVGDPRRDARVSRVPKGKYQISYLKHTASKRYGRLGYDIEFQIVFSPAGIPDREKYHGWRVRAFRTKVAQTRHPSRRSLMSKEFCLITRLLPPSSLHLITPDQIYSGCLLEARISDVEKDDDGDLVPEGARYSVVRKITGLVAGSPPYMRHRTRNW